MSIQFFCLIPQFDNYYNNNYHKDKQIFIELEFFFFVYWPSPRVLVRYFFQKGWQKNRFRNHKYIYFFPNDSVTGVVYFCTCVYNGKFRAVATDKFAAVHSNIFRVLGSQGSLLSWPLDLDGFASRVLFHVPDQVGTPAARRI